MRRSLQAIASGLVICLLNVLLQAEELDVPFHRQNTTVWCWAAAIAMVGEYATGTSARDCQILSAYDRRLGGPGACCEFPARCSRTGGSEEIKFILANVFGLRGFHNVRPLSYREVVREIDKGRPFIAGLQNGMSGHIIVVIGYEDPNLVILLDPMSGRHQVPYEKLRNNFMLGNWTETFTIQGRKGGGRRRDGSGRLFCCDAFGRKRCEIVVDPGPIGSPCWCRDVPGTGSICQ